MPSTPPEPVAGPPVGMRDARRGCGTMEWNWRDSHSSRAALVLAWTYFQRYHVINMPGVIRQ